MKDAPPQGPIHTSLRGSALGLGRRAVRYAVILFTVVLVVDAFVGEKGVLALLEAKREFKRVEAALAEARAENAALREQARRLREDPSAIEELARRELGLIKPGEKLFIVRDVEPKK